MFVLWYWEFIIYFIPIFYIPFAISAIPHGPSCFLPQQGYYPVTRSDCRSAISKAIIRMGNTMHWSDTWVFSDVGRPFPNSIVTPFHVNVDSCAIRVLYIFEHGRPYPRSFARRLVEQKIDQLYGFCVEDVPEGNSWGGGIITGTCDLLLYSVVIHGGT